MPFNTDLAIKKLQKADAPKMLQLFLDTVTYINSNDYSQKQIEAWKASGSTERIYSLLKEHDFFGVYIEGTLAGFCSLNHSGFIHSFFVSAHHQKMKIGSYMMQVIFELAAVKKLSKLSAEVSITAQPFFRKMGFLVTKPQIVFIEDTALRNFKMECSLNL